MALESLSIDQSSAPEQVANALRELLLKGEVPPGAKLKEVPLATAIGVSRHTLRSGFRILEAEGLLEHSLHRGVIVPELSAERIADVFKARKSLEFAGVHFAGMSNDRDDVIRGLRESVDRMREARDDAELAGADLDFHSAVVASTRSRIIDELYRNVQAQLRLTRAWAMRTRGDSSQMAKTHGAVIQHLSEGRRADAAQALMDINDVGESRLLEAMQALRESERVFPSSWPPNAADDQPAETDREADEREGGEVSI